MESKQKWPSYNCYGTAIFVAGMADNMAGIEADVNYSETKLELSILRKHSNNLSHFTHRLIC